MITGASSGIGKACAYFLAQNGFIVYAGTRTPEKVNIIHKNLYPIKLDLTNLEQLNNAISKIYKKHNNKKKTEKQGSGDTYTPIPSFKI